MNDSSPNQTQSYGETTPPKNETFGRYVLYAPIARGGMATVHIARLVGAEGFSRIVAAKRLHEQYTEDQDFVTMFLDEARISSKLHHPNVVSVLDVVLAGKDVVLVQEYVHGVPLDKLVKASQARGIALPISIAVAIVSGVLLGLHSAHETRDELGEPLNIVHRDVSPQNILVSADGIPRLLDFGIAKARSSAHVTQEGFFKGKITYIPPEQLRGEPPARTTDIYAAGVVLWELLVGRRMHAGRGESELFSAVLSGALPTVEEALADRREFIGDDLWQMLQSLSPIVAKALAKSAEDRYPTADAMAEALRAAVPPAPANELGAWVKDLGGEFLEARQKVITANEESWRSMRKIGGPTSSGAPMSSDQTSGVQPLRAGPRSLGAAGMSASTVPDFEARPLPPRRSNAPYLILLLLLLLLGGSGVFAYFLLLGRTPPPQGTGPEVSSTTAATAGASALAPITPPAPIGSAAAPTTGDGADANTLASSSSAISAAKPPPVVHPWHPPPPPRPIHPTPLPTTATTTNPPPTPTTNCNPPFYFDGTKKIFKPGCI